MSNKGRFIKTTGNYDSIIDSIVSAIASNCANVDKSVSLPSGLASGYVLASKTYTPPVKSVTDTARAKASVSIAYRNGAKGAAGSDTSDRNYNPPGGGNNYTAHPDPGNGSKTTGESAYTAPSETNKVSAAKSTSSTSNSVKAVCSLASIPTNYTTTVTSATVKSNLVSYINSLGLSSATGYLSNSKLSSYFITAIANFIGSNVKTFVSPINSSIKVTLYSSAPVTTSSISSPQDIKKSESEEATTSDSINSLLTSMRDGLSKYSSKQAVGYSVSITSSSSSSSCSSSCSSSSSSSSSSSCSSSCSSSSSSSSSSSCSSWFVGFLNLEV